MTAWQQPQAPVRVPLGGLTTEWSRQLAPRLFAPPDRWGWQTPVPAEAPQVPQLLAEEPRWVDIPAPDMTTVRNARASASAGLVLRIGLLVGGVVVFRLYGDQIASAAAELDPRAVQLYGIAVLVVGALLVVNVLRGIVGLVRASRSLAAFQRPYQERLRGERRRYQAALAQWQEARRAHERAVQEIAALTARAASGPQWLPVRPTGSPSRVDVLGGDPYRHGWASLLATMGSALVSSGQRLTVLDLSGHDVAGGLLDLTRAAGHTTRSVALAPDAGLDLLGGLRRAQVVSCVADAVIAEGSERREELALVSDTLTGVLEHLADPITFGRLAAAVRTLRQGAPDGRLSPTEIRRLVEHEVADVGAGEWVQRRLRLLASQLDSLSAASGDTVVRPLWSGETVSVVTTEGGRGDRKTLVDQMLVRLAREAVDSSGLEGVLVVAGADQLGIETLLALAEHARGRRVPLMLFIAQPPPDLSRYVGSGGAVCFMKMYNHVDATLAAEFIGRGHKFVVSQLTVNVGHSFGETGGDSFAANTTDGSNRTFGLGGKKGISDSRGQTWTGTRGWSSNQNVGSTHGASRVYEFEVEPAEMMQLPETAFLLVDSTGPGRRVVLADANPGICLLDRVASAP